MRQFDFEQAYRDLTGHACSCYADPDRESTTWFKAYANGQAAGFILALHYLAIAHADAETTAEISAML